jgi:branched-chain amino acid transport system substrate-binding protein
MGNIQGGVGEIIRVNEPKQQKGGRKMKKHFFRTGSVVVACVFLTILLCGMAPQPAMAKDKIVFGVVEPLSGVMKDVGDRYLNAVQFSAKKINEKGGLLGKEVVVIGEDGALKPDIATRKATKLILEDNADVIMTGTGSHISLAMMKVAKKHNKIFLTYGTEAASITGSEFNENMFRCCLNTDQHSFAVMAYFAKYTKFKKFYILCQDYAFGREAADGFKKKLKTIPGAELLGEDYHPIGLKDFAPYISKVMASGAEVVLTGNYGQDLDNLLKTGAALGWKVITGNYFLDDDIRMQAVKEAAIGHVTADAYMLTIDTPANKAFIAEWHKEHKDRIGFQYPVLSMARCYWAVQWLGDVIKRAGSTDAAKIIKAWEGAEYEVPWGKVTMRACDHQMITPGVAGVIQAKSEFFPGLPYVGKPFIIPAEDITVPPAESGNPRCK